MSNEEVVRKLTRKHKELAERACNFDIQQTLDSLAIELTTANIYAKRSDERTGLQLAWLAGALAIMEHWMDSVNPKG